MASQLEIVNAALGHISVFPITSMAEASPAAQEATRRWGLCRQEVLRGSKWPFSTVIVSLSTSNYTIVANDWSYAYQYPSDCLIMWAIYYNQKDRKQDFREVYDPVNGVKVLLTNISNAIGEYAVDLDTPELFDSAFSMALSYLLAARMAKPLTGDDKLAESMMKIYLALISEADRLSSYEEKVAVEQSSAFVDAREGPSSLTEDHYDASNRHPNG